MVHSGKGLELNTGSFRYGLRQPHPCTDVLRRYHELGGEIITVGSDAHKAQDVGSYLDLASEILQLCGFKYYTIYENAARNITSCNFLYFLSSKLNVFLHQLAKQRIRCP